jgi:signal transduction histidine kinase
MPGVVGDVIILWASIESPDTCPWMVRAPHGVRMVMVAPDAMAKAVPPAMARGAVIAIVSNDHAAHRALAYGVDEVVRAAEATDEILTAASERARLRAIGRSNVRENAPDVDAKAIELLSASVSYRLANPLAVASLNVEVLRAAMGAVTGLADAYARGASDNRGLLDSEAQRVVALRASAPATPDLHAVVNDLAGALREASSAVAHVYSLVASDVLDPSCDLTTVVSEVTSLVRGVIERVGDFRVELPADEPCRSTVPRSVVVQALSAVFTNALQAVRGRPKRGVIVVRVIPRVSAAIIEVTDSGVGMTTAALDHVLEPFCSTPAGRAPGLSLSLVADRIRRAGGDVVLESELGLGTTVRIFLPLKLRLDAKDPSAN